MDPDAVPSVEREPHGGTDDPWVLDFSSNVNPERPPGVVHAYDAAFGATRDYPHDDYTGYRQAAGAYLGCDPLDVVPTAGGMGALRLAIGVSVGTGDTALVPEPTFGEYGREVRLQGGEPRYVAADALLDADPADHAAAVVCNPNNPTGASYDPARLRAFAERCRDAGTVLVVDEAFHDFTDHPSLAGAPGVVVARSLTKVFGVPGLRAGFAVATGDLYQRLEHARPAWSLSAPAAHVGSYCLEQTEFVEETRAWVREERERLRDALAARFEVYPSEANFLLLEVPDEDPGAVVDRAREDGVLVRDARTFRGLDSHVRVAVRRRDANERLLAALGL